MINFGFRIKKLREQKNMSQEDLANILNISQSKIFKLENDRIKKIDFILTSKICEQFSINTDELMGKTA